MTQHHDPVHPDEPADAARAADLLSPADDAFVRSVLAALPEVAMPNEVVARIEAAIAAEPDLSSTLPAAAATVVPLASRRRTSTPRLLQAAAAIVLVAGGGVLAVKAVGQGSPSATSAGSEAAASNGVSGFLGSPVTTSGREYTAANLAASVLELTASTSPSGGPLDAGVSTPAAPTGDGRSKNPGSVATLASDPSVLSACIAALQGHPVLPQPAVSVDVGTFDQQPAVVVAVGNTDPKILTTYVVAPDCGVTAEPRILYFANVPRP